jgi:uncharacterized protein
MVTRFEWDAAKAKRNVAKHRGVSFPEATTVFSDPLASTFGDPRHSVTEERFVIIGRSHRGRCLAVMHTVREEVDGDGGPIQVVSIISARRATRAEISAYEEAR